MSDTSIIIQIAFISVFRHFAISFSAKKKRDGGDAFEGVLMDKLCNMINLFHGEAKKHFFANSVDKIEQMF